MAESRLISIISKAKEMIKNNNLEDIRGLLVLEATDIFNAQFNENGRNITLLNYTIENGNDETTQGVFQIYANKFSGIQYEQLHGKPQIGFEIVFNQLKPYTTESLSKKQIGSLNYAYKTLDTINKIFTIEDKDFNALKTTLDEIGKSYTNSHEEEIPFLQELQNLNEQLNNYFNQNKFSANQNQIQKAQAKIIAEDLALLSREAISTIMMSIQKRFHDKNETKLTLNESKILETIQNSNLGKCTDFFPKIAKNADKVPYHDEGKKHGEEIQKIAKKILLYCKDPNNEETKKQIARAKTIPLEKYQYYLPEMFWLNIVITRSNPPNGNMYDACCIIWRVSHIYSEANRISFITSRCHRYQNLARERRLYESHKNLAFEILKYQIDSLEDSANIYKPTPQEYQTLSRLNQPLNILINWLENIEYANKIINILHKINYTNLIEIKWYHQIHDRDLKNLASVPKQVEYIVKKLKSMQDFINKNPIHMLGSKNMINVYLTIYYEFLKRNPNDQIKNEIISTLRQILYKEKNYHSRRLEKIDTLSLLPALQQDVAAFEINLNSSASESYHRVFHQESLEKAKIWYIPAIYDYALNTKSSMPDPLDQVISMQDEQLYGVEYKRYRLLLEIICYIPPEGAAKDELDTCEEYKKKSIQELTKDLDKINDNQKTYFASDHPLKPYIYIFKSVLDAIDEKNTIDKKRLYDSLKLQSSIDWFNTKFASAKNTPAICLIKDAILAGCASAPPNETPDENREVNELNQQYFSSYHNLDPENFPPSSSPSTSNDNLSLEISDHDTAEPADPSFYMRLFPHPKPKAIQFPSQENILPKLDKATEDLKTVEQSIGEFNLKLELLKEERNSLINEIIPALEEAIEENDHEETLQAERREQINRRVEIDKLYKKYSADRAKEMIKLGRLKSEIKTYKSLIEHQNQNRYS